MSLDSGRRIGPYQVVARLGTGGMGEVYRARDAKLNREVAIKVMLADFAVDRHLRARFEREAQTLAALNHPNIAQIYGSEELDGGIALVMELVEGPTLAERFAAGPVTLADGLAIAEQMSDALAYAHDRGVIHRDLKPLNIKLRQDGTIKILDFGLAKKLRGSDADTVPSGVSTVGAVLGTPGYIAPELLRGSPASVGSDIFGFGVVLFEIFTGRHPFQRPSVLEISEAVLSAEPPPWPMHAESVPEVLQFIVRKAIEKDPRERYQSIHELRIDLRRVRRSSRSQITPLDPSAARATVVVPTPAMGATPASAARPGGSRLRTVAIAGIIAAAAGGAWLWRTSNRAPAAPPPAEVKHAQVTFTGDVRGVALSPDGRTAAYVVRGPDRAELFVRDVAGGDALARWSADLIVEVQWMPNGSEILVSGVREDRLGAWIVPRLSGDARPLAARGVRVGAHLAVSPDGQFVAAAFQNEQGFRILPVAGGPVRTVAMSGFQWLVGLDWGARTGQIAVLTQGHDRTSSVWTVAPEGGPPRKIYTDRAMLASLRWSPLADVLYVIRATRDVGELIRVVPQSSGAARAEVILPGLPWDPADLLNRQSSLSTDGRRLVYVRGFAYANLWRVPAAGGAPPSAITQATSRFGRPMLSPDGKFIVTSAGASGQSAIVRLPVSGGEPVRLTKGDAFDSSPAWSPDGTTIAFASNRNNAIGVWLVDPDGRPPSAVPDVRTSADPAITWTADGQLMWLKPDESNYEIRDPRGGAAAELLRPRPAGATPGLVSEARVSRDGSQVVVWWNRSGDETGLWVIDRRSGGERLLAAGEWLPAGWSPDGRWIYAFEPFGRGVFRIRATGGKPEPLARIGAGTLEACSVTPAGDALICTVGETRSDAWLVENFDSRPAAGS